jgi:hypothetical protein
VWEVMGPVPDALRNAIIAHLKSNCRFTFKGEYQLTGDPLPFYGEVLLCELVLKPGCFFSSGGKRKELDTAAVFYFLFRPDDEVLIPLTGGEGDILLANRWLGLNLENDAQRLDYARFYYAFARTERPPRFRNVPRKLSELRFKRPVTEQQIWGIYGAMWRFLVDAKTLDMRVHFEPRGSFWRARHRAHLPMQFGSDLYDVDLKIWERDGHVSYRKTALIYRDEALAEEPQERPGKIGRPRYVRRSEWLLTVYRNFKSRINQAAYLVAFALFLLASAIGLAFPLETWGYPLVRMPLELVAGATSIGDWTTWLRAACLYCIAYFVLTTLLILDLETFRNALLTWSPRFRKSRLNEFLYEIVVRRYRAENGYRRGLVRRIQGAASWLVIWTGYLVCVFTSLQTSFRPWLATDQKALTDVMQLFAEQALLYIPVVFYYVGRKSLDPAKVALVSFGVLLAFQLIMGLLVIRRVHRFWASTAAARLNEQIVRNPAPAGTASA